MFLSNLRSILLAIFWLCRIISCEIKVVPEVTIQEGTLRGATIQSRNGRNYHAFKGIRYVEQPKRFEIAEPPQKWEGVRDAIEPGDACAHQFPSSVGALMGTVGSEDCLFLHVYTPHENEEKKLPVMVYIHGGAFIFGSSNLYQSTYLLDEDIVLVILNYRLAAFGFLYTEDNLIPGNLGMRDQVAALKWVQRNIHHFGGDPNDVTIFGESAGSVSVHLMMLSPMAKGLFHKAIMQSGSALSAWAISTSPKHDAHKLAAAVGCPTANDAEMVNCLKTADMDDIAGAQADSRWNSLPEYHWAPVVERGPNLDERNAFLTEHPRVILERKNIPNNVPVMIGINKNEGAAIFSALILNDEENTREMDTNWNEIAPLTFLYLDEKREVDRTRDVVSSKIRHFYLGDHPVGRSTEQMLTDAFSDCYFVHGIHKAAKLHSMMAPTYIFLLTFSVGTSLLNAFGINWFETPTHLDDVPYLFPFQLKESLKDPREVDFSKKFVKITASFATKGKPEATWGPADIWPMVNATGDRLTWYRLDTLTQHVSDPYYHRVKFWDDLYDNDLKFLSM